MSNPLAREIAEANKRQEALAKAWDEGHRACDRDWEFAYDLTTPDEDRVPLTNPYRSARTERPTA